MIFPSQFKSDGNNVLLQFNSSYELEIFADAATELFLWYMQNSVASILHSSANMATRMTCSLNLEYK